MKGRVTVFGATERGTQGLKGRLARETVKTTLELDPKPRQGDKVTGIRPLQRGRVPALLCRNRSGTAERAPFRLTGGDGKGLCFLKTEGGFENEGYFATLQEHAADKPGRPWSHWEGGTPHTPGVVGGTRPASLRQVGGQPHGIFKDRGWCWPSPRPEAGAKGLVCASTETPRLGRRLRGEVRPPAPSPAQGEGRLGEARPGPHSRCQGSIHQG